MDRIPKGHAWPQCKKDAEVVIRMELTDCWRVDTTGRHLLLFKRNQPTPSSIGMFLQRCLPSWPALELITLSSSYTFIALLWATSNLRSVADRRGSLRSHLLHWPALSMTGMALRAELGEGFCLKYLKTEVLGIGSSDVQWTLSQWGHLVPDTWKK